MFCVLIRASVYSQVHILDIWKLKSISMFFPQADALIHRPDYPYRKHGASSILFAPQIFPCETI